MNQRLGPKLAAIVALLCLCTFQAVAANDRYLRIASGDVASGLFAQANAVAQLVNNPEAGVVAVAQLSSSGQAALAKLRSGGVDAAVVPDIAAHTAVGGDVARRGRPWPELRSLANLSSRALIIIIRGDQDVRSLANLQNWRIAVGPRSSDENNTITSLLAGLGLAPNFYRAVNADTNASPYDLIVRGQADAVVILANELMANERNGLLAGTLKLYSPGKYELERVGQIYPFTSRRVVDLASGGSYATVTSSSVLVARNDLPTAVVSDMLARLWLGAKAMADAKSAALHLPAPLHSAALNFYQEHKLMETDRAAP